MRIERALGSAGALLATAASALAFFNSAEASARIAMGFCAAFAAICALSVLVVSRGTKKSVAEQVAPRTKSPDETPRLREAIVALAEKTAETAALGPKGTPLREACAAIKKAASGNTDALLAAIRVIPGAQGTRGEEAIPLRDLGRRLAFARSIVGAVPTKTEEATFALLEKFTSVRDSSSRAAKAAKEARMGSTKGGAASVADTTERSRLAVQAEREAVAQMSAHNRKNVKNLKTMSLELESGIDLLKGIEEITERSRLIAFNMAVEAARIGDKGRGFRVIVGELRSLNERTAEFSRKVSELLGRFRDYNAALVTDMAEGSEVALKDVEKGMDAAESAVESLIGASDETDRFSREIAALAVEIDGSLDGILEALQFQDVTRQMIEGGIAVIEDAKADLETAIRLNDEIMPESSSLARERFEAIRRDLIARSKTKDEKEAIMEVRS